jgi:hypothetical protein
MAEFVSENELEDTILSLANFFDKQSDERNAELIKKLHDEFDKNESLYESEITLAFLYFTNFAAMPWFTKNPQVTDGWDKSTIQYIYNGILPHFVRTIIEQNEGTPFSGDKESFILNNIKKAIASGENISLYDTYPNQPEKQAYWSPRCFKDTNDAIKQFWDWYNLKEKE